MCGIAGIAAHSGTVDPELAAAMRDTMVHRGPDDSGAWISPDRRVALAHRRLAIIDLSPGGHQPMADLSGSVRVVFNGEIYNYRELRRELAERGHRFGTASDTEVLLSAYREWGTDCLARLNGMFAFVLHDALAGRLFIARDRAGEKPLYYRHAAGTLHFASELKALLADPSIPRVIDRSSLDFYLAYGYAPGDSCILQGIRKLPPACAMTYDIESDELRGWSYWSLPDPPSAGPFDPRELEEELERLLLDSVRLRLIADVPVGILLSGGIDSGLVTAMAARASSGPVKTFTVSFPGHGARDEGPQARLTASHFGTEHTELAAEPAAVDLLPLLARQFDEPIGDPSILPTYLISRRIRREVTVALGGDGGDELFGGYPHYSLIRKLDRIGKYLPAAVGSLAGASAARFLPVGMKGRNHVIGLGGGLSRNIAHVNLYFDRRTRARLLAPLGAPRPHGGRSPEGRKELLCARTATALRQATEADFRTTLADDYLVKVDRASMLASLEVRAPFLDHRLIELAFGRVPDSLRATESERKILLRRIARRLLPASLDLSGKRGFELPLAAWLRGEWGGYVGDVLARSDPRLFDPKVVGEVVAGLVKGYANANRIFLLTMFELWRREYRAQIPEARGGR